MISQFEFGKVVSGSNFLDRENERKQLSNNIKSGINTILVSPRRWGKSSLVNQVAFENEDPGIVFCFLDLFNIRSEEDFYQKLANQLIKSTSSKWEEWVETGKKFIKNLVPRFSFGDDPMHDFTLSLDMVALKQSAEEILELPEKIALDKGIRLVICLDEFQNISFFDQPLAFQKQLRSYWQHQKHCCYIIYGSKRNMMNNLFQDRQMPFYRFGDMLMLGKIAQDYWTSYIQQGFEKTGKSISKAVAMRIPDLMENHPYYVQYLAYQCWNLTDIVCSQEILDQAINEILLQQSILYQREIDNLTNLQLNFLKALSSGEKQLSSASTMKKFSFGSQGNIKRIKESLENKEILDITGKQIELGDPLFKIWIERNLLPL